MFGPALLLLVLGFGITTDVEFADLSPCSTSDNSFLQPRLCERNARLLLFRRTSPDPRRRGFAHPAKSGAVSATIEIPPGFGRDIKRGRQTEVSVWIDGAMPFRAETIHGYLQGVHLQFLSDPAIRGMVSGADAAPASIETRFRYNQDFDSIYAMVPGAIALQLALIPAILMALAIVREKELGSITNLYVTPVTRLEFLLGKQIPYIALAFVDFLVMFVMAIYDLRCPAQGRLHHSRARGPGLCRGDDGLWHGGLGLHQHADRGSVRHGHPDHPAREHVRRHVHARLLDHRFRPRARGVFPMTYFLPICVGAFTKGLGFADLSRYLALLALFAPALILISLLLLRKQEK